MYAFSSHRALALGASSLALLAAALLMLSSGAVAVSADGSGSGSTASGTTFSDIASHWGADYITWLQGHCGVTGYKNANGQPTGEFRPDRNITRAEFVKMVIGCKDPTTGSGSTASGSLTGSGSTGSGSTASGSTVFPDVPAGHWAAAAIAKAKQLNLVTGYADGSFRPDQNITRAEILAIVLRSEFPGANLSSTTSPFSDVASEAWYAKYVAFGADKAIVSGYRDASGALTGEFGPENPATRAEAAKIISNGLNAD